MGEFEMRRERRKALQGCWERLSLAYARHRPVVAAGISRVEMRAKPNGTGGTDYVYTGYATVYGAEFDMWDQRGDPFTEVVLPGAARRSLGNRDLDVRFLIGHNQEDICLASTKAQTMRLSDDSHGVHVEARMDGSLERVRQLASAVERRDMDEMSLAFVCNEQQWDDAYEHRSIVQMELQRGDVSAVVYGANPATAGSTMVPAELLAARRPVVIGGPVLLLERRAAMSLAEQHGHPGRPCLDPDGDGDCDLTPEGDTDHDYWSADGRQLKPLPGQQDERAAGWLVELLSVTQAERDRAHAAGNSLPDGSYPINNVAQLHSAAVLAASHHGDWKAAQALIRRRAKELGVDVTTLPGFGEEKSSGMPVERRASAADNINLADDPDYNAADMTHDVMTGVHSHPHRHPNGDTADHEHMHDNDNDHSCGGSATVTVDATTGIPGQESQYGARQRLELRMRELELEEMSCLRLQCQQRDS